MTERRPIRVGLAQLCPVPYDAEAARAASIAATAELFGDGADVVVLPELVVPGYGLDVDALRAVAEDLSGPTISAWRALAAEHGGIVVGGLCERGDDGALHNTAVAVDGDGVLLHYRKLHLFGTEKLVFAPGDRGLPVATTRWGLLGICVCYDLRFVETLRVLALRGAELVCVPAAWVRGFDAEPAGAGSPIPQVQGLLVQANLDQVFVAAASQAGSPADHDLLGSSLVADPFGRVVAGPLDVDARSALVDVDLAEVDAAGRRSELVTPRADRRGDVYGLVVDGTRL